VLFAVEDGERCDLCGAHIAASDDGAPRGLYMWTRGSDVRWEEPPLCDACASAIGITAVGRVAVEDEDE
jgi:hypothetical protein